MSTMTSVESADIGSIMRWLENPIEGGVDGIVVYPNLQTFREICTQYVKDQLVGRQKKEEEEEEEQKEANMMIITKTTMNLEKNY